MRRGTSGGGGASRVGGGSRRSSFGVVPLEGLVESGREVIDETPGL